MSSIIDRLEEDKEEREFWKAKENLKYMAFKILDIKPLSKEYFRVMKLFDDFNI